MLDSLDVQLDWVAIFETNDRFVIGLVKGLLEDAGIPLWMKGDETAAQLGIGPLMFPPCQFFVPRDRNTESRDLLVPLAV